MHKKQYIFAVAQKDPKVEHPKQEDLFEVGTLAQVKQLVSMPGNVVRVIIVGQKRMKLEILNIMTDIIRQTYGTRRDKTDKL